jgi:hypothetical protein
MASSANRPVIEAVLDAAGLTRYFSAARADFVIAGLDELPDLAREWLRPT